MKYGKMPAVTVWNGLCHHLFLITHGRHRLRLYLLNTFWIHIKVQKDALPDSSAGNASNNI